jgi:histidine ammonia-lyase
MDAVLLDRDGLTIDQVVAVARRGAPAALAPGAAEWIGRGRELVERWAAEGRRVYGVTTGFGALSDISISPEQTRQLQRNILLSHAAGVGEPLAREAVRAAMLLRVKDIAAGRSGVGLPAVQALLGLLNADVVPIVPSQGSVGASGDLAPLAHLALVLIGHGQALYRGRVISGQEALGVIGREPVDLGSGEGLGLINGTQIMSALGCLAVHDARRLARTADLACALSLEVLMGTRVEFDPRIHAARPHPGQAAAAENMLRLTQGSEIITSHKDCHRIQDAYTLRCSPQVHGASRDALGYVWGVVETEINSATNNPLIFPETGEFLLGGNFHGQPVALALDFLALAAAELGCIAERRVERLVNPQLSGLPAFLVKDGGLNSGFMIAQYTAAALVSENKVLAHPACVDSIPTSANKEDHVSMGTIAARKAVQVVANVERVLAIELLCAAQALDLFTNLRPGLGTGAAYRAIRERIGHLDQDRYLAGDIAAMVELVQAGTILTAAEGAIGPLL